MTESIDREAIAQPSDKTAREILAKALEERDYGASAKVLRGNAARSDHWSIAVLSAMEEYAAIRVALSTRTDTTARDAGLVSAEDRAKNINLALLMCNGISEQDAGFDKIVSLNDAGLRAVTQAILADRAALKSPQEGADIAGGEALKLPVAFRVKDFADGWIIYQDEKAAYNEAERTGAVMQGLYVKDGKGCRPDPSPSVAVPKHTDAQVQALASAMWQLLDDMGSVGLCVCEQAKMEAFAAFAPFQDFDALLATPISVDDPRYEKAIADYRAHPSFIPSSPASVAVPEGWKLVPIEPTEDMIQAGCDNNPTMFNEGTDRRFNRDVANDVYVSMLAASPSPSQLDGK